MIGERTCSCARCGEDFTKSGRPTRIAFCPPCDKDRKREQFNATRIVRRNIASGKFPPVTGKKCCDCGAPAVNYDHRDYTKPLEVDPVCKACNQLRGPGADSKMRVVPTAAGWVDKEEVDAIREALQRLSISRNEFGRRYSIDGGTLSIFCNEKTERRTRDLAAVIRSALEREGVMT